jgi:TetR/AcrR family transcriptional regulator
MMTKANNRKEQILQALALELEQRPGERITTANLAKAVGVSEAALYRHFPSKAKMFDALLDFSETAVFGLITQSMTNNDDPVVQIENIMTIILVFSTRNPGITRVLLGDALVGENERLLKRSNQFFERIETQLRSILREGELSKKFSYQGSNSYLFASLLLSILEGQLNQYVRSQFTKKPDKDWPKKWALVGSFLVPEKI